MSSKTRTGKEKAGKDLPRSDNYIDPESENVEYSIFYKLADVEDYILDQEIEQTTKFILNRICKGFGTPDPGAGWDHM